MRVTVPLNQQARAVFYTPLMMKAYQNAFIRIAKLLDERFKEIIRTPGVFDGFPQDIVDTGALLRSQKMTIVGIGIVRWDWDVDYAIFVHEGYTLRNGMEQQGRPWTKIALEGLDLPQLFANFFQLELQGFVRF